MAKPKAYSPYTNMDPEEISEKEGFSQQPGLNTSTLDAYMQSRNAVTTLGQENVGTVVEDTYIEVVINGQRYHLNLKKL